MADSLPDRCRVNEKYPAGATAVLLASDLVTPATCAVLKARLDGAGYRQESSARANPRHFDEHGFATLRAASARLIPQLDRALPIDLARGIDERLADGLGNGWRYAVMPPDGEAYVRGLCGMNESAQERFGIDFVALDATRQDVVLHAIQSGEVSGVSWDAVPATRFFEELLAELTELYYAHPLAQDEIGYTGFADAHGWQALGLNELELWETRPLPLVGTPSG